LKIKCNQEGVEKASEIIKDGGIVIFPTDTVYGIGCNPYNRKSIQRIYKIKSRERTKSFPILAFSKEIATKIVEFDRDSEKIAEKIWPGPLTIVLKLTDEKLKEALNVADKVAIRVPNHQCALRLLEKCDFIVGTSANISGSHSFRNPEECYQNIHDYDLFLDGGTITSSGESTIIEFIDGKLKIHREGVLTQKEILKLL
jgi:L-threonylcarbamoyladenylate synthase